ncbi:MAG TPA: hypothetical protein VGO25_11620 [Rhodanobacteraceae bacterium]|jgi:hypothetical protein|nr:hypothetical protein [Rhodanobacteraceae bacterium]
MAREESPAVARRTFVASVLALAVAACSEAPTRPEDGIDVTPKANKNYIVDGRVLSFVEFEALVSSTPPASIVLEQSRIRQGAACIVMLSLKNDIPVWTRTLNGRMHKVRADVKSSEIETIEHCR